MEPLIFFFRRVAEFSGDALAFLGSLEPIQFLTVFWAFFFLEIPRYVVSDLYVLARHLLTRNRRDPLMEPLPTVSVIVSVLNEERTIPSLVRSLHEQRYPHLEIIVIDDGSCDRTKEICERLAMAGAIRFFPLASRQGKSAALTYGCRLATGQILVFMDADTTLDREALIKIVQPFRDERIGAVCGNVGVRNVWTNLFTRIQAVEYLIAITVGRQFRAHMGILGIVSGAFGAFRRELVERTGWHDPGPGNDSDLTIRIRKLGKHIAFAPEATCLTNVPDRVTAWVRQRMRWDRNVIRNRVRKHRDIYNVFHHHFRLTNLLSFVDTVFFSVVLSLTWLIYAVHMVTVYPHRYGLILFVNYCLYSAAKLTQFAIALTISERRELWRLIVALPFFVAYRVCARVLRIVASLQELLFHASDRDPFAPEKVRKQMAPF
ncbi:MAG: glycosyltransferase family 2 protein [Nitrospirae bacterium]|nr:MAG: glycosyltransferase family 2 protein [Nitrospirota bacterium]